MRFSKWFLVVASFCVVIALSLNVVAKRPKKTKPAETTSAPVAVKTIAIGDFDAGYSISGQKAYAVKESIQLALKRELEKKGFNVNITSPAVVTAGSKAPDSQMPTFPQGGQATQADMAKYMAQMQQWQDIKTGKKKLHKPVAADYYVEGQVQSGQSGVDTGGAMSTISRFTGVYTSIGNVSTKSTKVNLVCTLRDPASGALVDRYVAKASRVKFRNIAGVTSYNYGNDSMTYDKLFKNAVKKCAKWIASKAQ